MPGSIIYLRFSLTAGKMVRRLPRWEGKGKLGILDRKGERRTKTECNKVSLARWGIIG